MNYTKRCKKEILDASPLMSPNEPRADYVYFCGDIAVVVEEVNGRSRLKDVYKLENTVKRLLDRGRYRAIVAVLHHKKADTAVVKELTKRKQESRRKPVKYETAACDEGLKQLLRGRYGVEI